jgi:magnesium-transporting ATPase (P-type)
LAILTIDLGTDLVPALALGAERPEPGVMDRPPRRLSDHIVTPGLVGRAYLFLGPIQSLAVMALFFVTYWTGGYAWQLLDLPDEGRLYEQAVTMALIAVVATQIGNLFAQRAERQSVLRVGWFSNRLVWVGIASELAIVAFVVYVPFLQDVIGTTSVPLSNWLWAVPLVPVLLLADELRKMSVRRRDRRDQEVTRP